jgi:putative ABC transport system permease protein
MHGDAVEEIRPALVALFAGVGLVLLIACVNVANLLLARGIARRKEMSLRAALGASRRRLLRQLLLESLILAAVGGLLGLLLGAVCLDRLAALAPPGVLPAKPLALDRGVLGFAALVSLLAGVVFGILPALGASRVDLADALKSAAGVTASSGRRSRAALVIGEVALSFILLVGAGLMIRTFLAVRDVDPGLRAAGALSFEVTVPGRRYRGDEGRAAFVREVSRRLGALPGVEAVGAVSHLPFDDYPNWYSPYAPEGASDERRRALMADHRSATPDYLRALGATLLRGRLYDALDETAARAVVVIDDQLAEEAWPGQDPLGKTLEHEQFRDGGFAPRKSEVIGVVRHVTQQGLTRQLRGQIYIPYAQSARPHLSFVVRTGGDPLLLVDGVRREIAALDGELALAKIRPMTDYMETAARPARFTMVLATIFGALALALAAIGIYGVIATSVSQRRRELGVRLALGAMPGKLLRHVLNEGLVLTLIGLAIGVLASLASANLLRALLFGVSPLDPATYVIAAVVLPLAAVLASFFPARRAAREDPMTVLRVE